MLDLVLAVVHHVLIFGIFGVLFAAFMTVRPGMSSAAAVRIASIDLWYGLFAGAIVIIGFCRAIFAAKGRAYYSHDAFFWVKIATFAGIGILSVPPTIAFTRWRKSGVPRTRLRFEKPVVICTLSSRSSSYCSYLPRRWRGYGEI